MQRHGCGLTDVPEARFCYYTCKGTVLVQLSFSRIGCAKVCFTRHSCGLLLLGKNCNKNVENERKFQGNGNGFLEPSKISIGTQYKEDKKPKSQPR